MANSRDHVFIYTYVDDGAKNFNVELTQAVGEAGGFDPGADGQDSLPKHLKMRHVGIQFNDGTRGSCPIAKIDNDAYKTGGSFTKDGKNGQVTGRIGEKKRLSGNIAP